MKSPIRIILADDHPLFRDGLRRTLSAFDSCEVVAECGNARDVVNAVCEIIPDIVLLDIGMPGNGIEAARCIAETCPSVRIIMLTSSERKSDLTNALEVGACGYVLKGVGGEKLLQIIETVQGGGVYVSPTLATRVLMEAVDDEKSEDPTFTAALSNLEQEVLRGIVQGWTNREIASQLSINDRAVDRHVTNVMRKIGVRNRLEAALKAQNYFSEH